VNSGVQFWKRLRFTKGCKARRRRRGGRTRRRRLFQITSLSETSFTIAGLRTGTTGTYDVLISISYSPFSIPQDWQPNVIPGVREFILKKCKALQTAVVRQIAIQTDVSGISIKLRLCKLQRCSSVAHNQYKLI